MFDSAGQASASNEAARDFVAEYVRPLLPNAPMIVEGSMDLTYVAVREQMMDDARMPLYAALRIYDNYDLSYIDSANEIVETMLLPAQQEAGGLFGYYSINDGNDIVVGLSIYNSEENALAANDIAAEIVTTYMADWLPDDPIRINGRLGVAALAEIDMGANQAAWEMMGG